MSASSSLRRKANEARNKKLRREWRAEKGKWPLKDPEYLKWIRAQRCICCSLVRVMAEHGRFNSDTAALIAEGGLEQSTPTEAAHVGDRGLGQKSSDHETIPLCEWHHREGPSSAHKLQKGFWRFWNFDRDTILQELNRQYEEQK